MEKRKLAVCENSVMRKIFVPKRCEVPITGTARSRGCSLAGIVGSNPAGGHGCLSLVSVVCCQVEVSASGLSFVQRSHTECGMSECDRESSIMRRP